jgi:hypothetical protein
MNRWSYISGCAVGLATMTFANPYDTIATRNAFNLKPVTVETSRPGEVFQPAPEYRLTGIAGFGASKWALLTKADPGKPPQHFTIRQGQREGPLEVVYIDEIANLVRIRNDGTLVELTFSTNTVANTDRATQRFVEHHTRAHELHQQREAARIARERAQFERMSTTKPAEALSPPEQAILEQQ